MIKDEQTSVNDMIDILDDCLDNYQQMLRDSYAMNFKDFMAKYDNVSKKTDTTSNP